MKRSLLAVLLVATVASPAEAVPVRWQGDFTVTAQTGTCEPENIGTGGRARFRPGIGGENGADTSLSVFDQRQTVNYRLVGGLFNSTFQAVETRYIGDTALPVDRSLRIKIVSQKPEVIDANVDFIDIIGQVRNYDFQTGCTVTFRMTLFRRVF